MEFAGYLCGSLHIADIKLGSVSFDCNLFFGYTKPFAVYEYFREIVSRRIID